MLSMPEVNVSSNPLAILGEEDVVLGFKALGFKVYGIKEQEDSRAALNEIIQQNCAICLVQDDIYQALEDEINSYKSMPLPIFIPFSKNIETDLLQDLIKDIRIKATGAI